MTVERILAWYRVGSSVGAVAALIVANLVPLIGVLFFGWSVWNILIVYWLENGVVGAFNVLKMATAQGAGLPEGMTAHQPPGRRDQEDEAHPVLHRPLRPVLGRAWHLRADPAVPVHRGARSASGVDPATILFAAIVLGISHGVSYWWNYLHGGEYRRMSAAQLMFAPYGRLLVLHMTIILGAVAIGTTGASRRRWRFSSLIKIALDLGLHLAEHRRVAPTPEAMIALREPARRRAGGVHRGPRDVARVARGESRHVGRRVARHVANPAGSARLPYEEAVEEALCFGWVDGTAGTVDEERGKQYFAPRKPNSGWAATNKARVERLIAEGRMAPAGLAAIERAKANGSWELLDSVERLEVPADLAAALDAHPPAAANFAAFPPSVRKQLLASLVMARRPETRAERVRRIAEAAARNERTPA